MIIGVIGGGVVGRATAHAFKGCEEVLVHDRIAARATAGLYWTLRADLVFICIPAEELEPFFESLPVGQGNFVIKSTVPIGTTRRLQERFPAFSFVHSPEFLTERTALLDASMPARVIIGSPDTRRWSDDRSCERILFDLCFDRFSGAGAAIHQMSSDESELVKLVDNAFGAVKIAFFNEARSLADDLELDWERVLAGVLAGGRIHPEHTRVPGPDGKRGFGGRCLPKDLGLFIDELEDRGLAASVSVGALQRNREDREL